MRILAVRGIKAFRHALISPALFCLYFVSCTLACIVAVMLIMAIISVYQQLSWRPRARQSR